MVLGVINPLLLLPIYSFLTTAFKGEAMFIVGNKKGHRGDLSCISKWVTYMILDTTPAPTVRPPSRIAKRKPSSIAIG
jgi:hypothetical protein